MRPVYIIYYLYLNIVTSHQREFRNLTCGIDNSPITVVYEGVAKLETYPWMGMLYYPLDKKRLTTVVILVTKQMVIGTASEIDKLPKEDFRARSKVILGHTCGEPTINIRDYTLHGDYSKSTYSALALIQLEVDNVKQELRPICPPPAYFLDAKFYAIALSAVPDCKKAMLKIYKMKYVNMNECRTYYRKSGLDVESIWPTHSACARTWSGNECIWRSGSILVTKQGRRWRLLGFGVYGPGCRAPARFIDYGMYHQWVKVSVSRIGRPAITRMGREHLILRRTLSNIQRFGPCDSEEMRDRLYTDYTNLTSEIGVKEQRIKYNLTLYANVEYSCVVFRVYHDSEPAESPLLRLRRWCAGSTAICFDHQYIEIDFYVEIYFSCSITFEVNVYGKEAKMIDSVKAMVYANEVRQYPRIPNFNTVKKLLNEHKTGRTNYWFYSEDTGVTKNQVDNSTEANIETTTE